MPVRHQWTGALVVALRVVPRANTQSPYKQGTWRERPYQSEGLPYVTFTRSCRGNLVTASIGKRRNIHPLHMDC